MTIISTRRKTPYLSANAVGTLFVHSDESVTRALNKNHPSHALFPL